METADESPQLGDIDVDREALAAGGVAIAALANELGAEVDEQSTIGAPVDGWRVLKSHTGGSILIGAPRMADVRVGALRTCRPILMRRSACTQTC